MIFRHCSQKKTTFMTSSLLPLTTKSFQKEGVMAAGGANWFIEKFAVENGDEKEYGSGISSPKHVFFNIEKK